VEWPDGALDLTPDDLTIPGGGTVERTVRVEAAAGDLGTLNPTTARIVVGATRTAPPPSASATPSQDAEQACRDLDSSDLAARTRAGERLRAHAPVLADGTERPMEAAAAWCESAFGIRPSWWTRHATPAVTVEACEETLVAAPSWAGWRESRATDPCVRLARCTAAGCRAATCLQAHYGCLDSGTRSAEQERRLGAAYFVTVACCPE
jgi:hypothetical protein